MPNLFSTRRFSNKSSKSPSGIQNISSPTSPPTAFSPQMQNSMMQSQQNGSALQDSRPASSATDNSFEFTQRPASHSMPNQTYGNLSRTDQVVLRAFWEYKSEDNKTRDLHFLKFPAFSKYPAHHELVPYCEIYHLVKTSAGAKIISCGSANGVYIGFELFSGSQLHIDMDDDWQNISHYKVAFKNYEQMLKDPMSEQTFKSWPKPLTIEFLEDQYKRWCEDLTSLCWDAKEVRELGSGGGHGNGNGNDMQGANEAEMES